MKRRASKDILVVFSVVAAAFMSCAVANEPTSAIPTITPSPYYETKEKGWFWYEEPPPPEEAEQKKVVEPPTVPTPAPEPEKRSPDEKTPFSAEWLRVNMPILLDRAIDDPTEENVRFYLYAKRMTLDKAQNFATMSSRVVASDPFLDENNRVPLSTFAKKEFLAGVKNGQRSALEYLSGQSGIWMFFEPTCEFCHVQSRIIQNIAKKYAFQTRFISLSGGGMPHLAEHYVDQGQAKAIGVSMTPTTVLVVPPSTYLIVSQGMMSEDQLEERIVLAADSKGILPEEFKREVNLYSQGLLTTDMLSDGAGDKPEEWLKRLTDKMKVR